ncbi:hypothetical protein DKP76_18790 [Falsochrobactrum shanghaiense]|uniref:Excalibur calcium-binding domain-containing protein n=2 Tax=Falsochrobactrum shanghaiense TaxID=2201899 RepID=A0A316J2S7_9HYPH|nr:hypothetical protein DKP76_18790 [Falsochrobactrum shanghaiense]
MVVNKGTWRNTRQYNFEEEYRRKKAARQKRIARERVVRIQKMLWWPTITVMILVLATLIVWRPLQSVRIDSVWDGIRHLTSAPNCNAARAVGLAPARRGQPGYWPSHDADNDGVACEPWPR